MACKKKCIKGILNIQIEKCKSYADPLEIPRNPTAGLWLTTFSTSSDCRIGNFTEIVFEWNFIFKPP